MLNQIPELFFKKRTTRKSITLLMVWIVILAGCLEIKREKHFQKETRNSLQWNIQSYVSFLRQNIIKTGEKYTIEYEPCEFIVDTDYGSTLIQNLIKPEAVLNIQAQLGINDLEYYDKLSKIFEYVKNNYDFVIDPYNWPTVEETIRAKKGDCNSLSLLLMSLLLSAGIQSHAAISNGHMWVSALHDDEWHILEVDRDPERKRIYSLPGFYQNPVYIIFSDHSEKRKLSVSLKHHQNS